jgi:hypothetical protein
MQGAVANQKEQNANDEAVAPFDAGRAQSFGVGPREQDRARDEMTKTGSEQRGISATAYLMARYVEPQMMKIAANASASARASHSAPLDLVR